MQSSACVRSAAAATTTNKRLDQALPRSKGPVRATQFRGRDAFRNIECSGNEARIGIRSILVAFVMGQVAAVQLAWPVIITRLCEFPFLGSGYAHDR